MNFKYYKTESLVIFIIIIYLPCALLSGLIEEALKPWNMLDSISKFSHSFSTLTLMTFGLVFVNNVAWKWSIFRWLIDLPNLNGRYSGQLISSFKDSQGNAVKMDCVVEIRQNASKIQISSYFSVPGSGLVSSSSHSALAEIGKNANGFFKIYYIFVNDTGFLEGEVRNHTGTATFVYHPDNESLEGDYYNQRGNKGVLVVKFAQKERLGRYNA